MVHFKSWQSYRAFRRRITREARYILDAESQKFLDTLIATSEDRQRVFDEGKAFFWRAQLGHDWREMNDEEGHSWDDLVPYSPKRMTPFPDKATEGRANPKGIPCLYLSTLKETAMSEVRPLVGAYISVSQFKTTRKLTIIDLSVLHDASHDFYFEEPEPEKLTSAVWSHVDQAFSEPVSPSDDLAEYVPTQIIAERFKHEGFDGIAYKSAFGEDGYNVALFDLDAAECVNGFLYEAKAINIEFKQIANHYSVQRKDKDQAPSEGNS